MGLLGKGDRQVPFIKNVQVARLNFWLLDIVIANCVAKKSLLKSKLSRQARSFPNKNPAALNGSSPLFIVSSQESLTKNPNDCSYCSKFICN